MYVCMWVQRLLVPWKCTRCVAGRRFYEFSEFRNALSLFVCNLRVLRLPHSAFTHGKSLKNLVAIAQTRRCVTPAVGNTGWCFIRISEYWRTQVEILEILGFILRYFMFLILTQLLCPFSIPSRAYVVRLWRTSSAKWRLSDFVSFIL